MPARSDDALLRPALGVKETVESDQVLRWDGERLYVEQDVYHNGQLVHRKYKRGVTPAVAAALATLIGSGGEDRAGPGSAPDGSLPPGANPLSRRL